MGLTGRYANLGLRVVQRHTNLIKFLAFKMELKNVCLHILPNVKIKN